MFGGKVEFSRNGVLLGGGVGGSGLGKLIDLIEVVEEIIGVDMGDGRFFGFLIFYGVLFGIFGYLTFFLGSLYLVGWGFEDALLNCITHLLII